MSAVADGVTVLVGPGAEHEHVTGGRAEHHDDIGGCGRAGQWPDDDLVARVADGVAPTGVGDDPRGSDPAAAVGGGTRGTTGSR